MAQSKFDRFLGSKVRHLGMTGVTFQLEAENKERCDRIAMTLNKSSAEVYRELVNAALPELEQAVKVWLERNHGGTP